MFQKLFNYFAIFTFGFVAGCTATAVLYAELEADKK
jgi:hypothetical protein